jgi:hypothetical protein
LCQTITCQKVIFKKIKTGQKSVKKYFFIKLKQHLSIMSDLEYYLKVLWRARNQCNLQLHSIIIFRISSHFSYDNELLSSRKEKKLMHQLSMLSIRILDWQLVHHRHQSIILWFMVVNVRLFFVAEELLVLGWMFTILFLSSKN